MSVAFRRESDEEHLEPKVDLPITPGPNLVTARGLAITQEKVAALEAELAATSDEAALEKVKRRLKYWRTRLATAQPMPVPEGDLVAFGCTVTFRLNGAERTIHIVGDDEADPTAGYIAFSAPLARAMMDAEEGERVDFAGKAEAVEIVAIRPIEVG
ncbi:GreA/GreB family elongation factor [Sphingobium sp. H39-3-25]|uniref:GreA/GreB family elongation factor n=1 Tax=Sphingobium arseniciresistens TaxID=3030834 RepID=UPI0023B946C1|nr:GreA/GreB family elongation factor [Sphingobium arseniciresistens]